MLAARERRTGDVEMRGRRHHDRERVGLVQQRVIDTRPEFITRGHGSEPMKLFIALTVSSGALRLGQ